MAGERDLATLLATMTPELVPGRFVFVRVDDVPDDVEPFAVVREEEGTTLVMAQQDADRLGLGYDHVTARITMRVHSALDAVGLTAAFATALAADGLSCNVLAGWFHDHLFVPYDDGPRAVEVLQQLSAAGR